MKLILTTAALALGITLGPQVTAQSLPLDLDAILTRAGERVEAFFTRAQSLVCTEIVTMQPLNSGLTADGFSRVVESELRVSWNAADEAGPVTEAQTRRQVLKVNGRPPREKDHRSCTTPEQNDSETQPLSLLLSSQRVKYSFSAAGTARVDGRGALLIDFREVGPVSADVRAVEGLEDCISYDVTGGQRGRVWLDAETFDVLRLDQRLTQMVELRMPRVLARRPGSAMFLTVERSDTSMRFERVSFSNPEESLILPSTTSELRIVRGTSASRLRTMTRFSNYKRFLTGSRVVGEARR